VRISMTRPAELGKAEIDAWRSMQLKSSSLANPFLCPEFTLGIGESQPAARVAVLTEGGEIVGFFPFEQRRFGVGASIGAVLSNCQGLIHSPGVQWDARWLLKACKVSAWQFDKLAPNQMPFEQYIESRTPAAIIDLSRGFEAYREGFELRSSSFLNKLGRRTRSLEKKFGEVRITVNSRDTAELRTLMSWKSDQCRQNGWLDVFERSWVVDLIDNLFALSDDSFRSVLSMLYVGETPAAAALWLGSRGFMTGWYTAYDPKFKDYSPGLIHFIRAAEGLAAAGVQTLEFGGTDHYQEKLKNGDLYYSKGTAATGRFTAGAHRVRVSAEGWARRQIKRSPLAYRAADRALKCLGRIA
jgi:CelD/BcsL family acetyltransferase involved in cellulose biosynthesis